FSVLGVCPAFYKQEVWRTFGSASLDEFMKNFWEAWFLPMDANNLLSMGWKWRNGDVSRLAGGDLKRALGRIQAKTYVMPFANDMLLPLEDCVAEQEMIAGSELRFIPTTTLFRSSDKLVLTSVPPTASAPVLQMPKAASSTLYLDSLSVNGGNLGC